MSSAVPVNINAPMPTVLGPLLSQFGIPTFDTRDGLWTLKYKSITYGGTSIESLFRTFLTSGRLSNLKTMGSQPVLEAAYGSWESPITTEFISKTPNCQSIKELALDFTDFGRGVVYWVEQRNDGRCAVYSCNTSLEKAGGGGDAESETDAEKRRAIREWNEHPFSARTKVHEYGGGVLAVNAGIAYFMTPDGVWRQDSPHRPPDPLVQTNDHLRYADPTFAHNSIYCVMEDHTNASSGGAEPVNSLVRISPAMMAVAVVDKARCYIYHVFNGLNGGLQAASELAYSYPEVSVMVSGADFYATPRVSRGGTKFAWMQWNHPNMPWDATEIWVADLEMSGAVLANSQRRVLGGDGQTNYMQPQWSSADELYVIADCTDWWNIYEVDFVNGTLKRNILPLSEDIGRPHWVFGSPNRVYSFERVKAGSPQRVVLAAKEQLLVVSLADAVVEAELSTGYVSHHSVSFGRDDAVYAVAEAPDKPTAVIRVDLLTKKTTVIREQADSAALAKLDISAPETIEFPTGNPDFPTASGYFYPPKNSRYKAPEGSRPPVILKAHGGPTTFATRELNWETQYFTSRGFALMDVNYRGSTGFGRRFRSCLYGRCGDWDVDDVCSAAKHLVKLDRVDPAKLCIRGGSAGGYIVLRSVVRPNVFAAGVSLYGISDVEALMLDTHKFESHYDCFAQGITDPAARIAKFRDLSPINHLNDICVPVAFFQGDQDMVVPLNQAEAMYKAVKQRGFKTSLVVFKGESHGFVLPENKSLCLNGSYYYFCLVLGIKPAVDAQLVKTMVIDNN